MYLTEDQLATTKAKQSDVKRGYWNEPVGPGPEWYGHRVGLGLVYLAAGMFVPVVVVICDMEGALN